ncbi:hypothetical protein DFQ29_006204 [Apophysomyces sp. BC1021]|nr:hypothetical protein DFQ29_006204 [Apophysomyces sp. BC1021]
MSSVDPVESILTKMDALTDKIEVQSRLIETQSSLLKDLKRDQEEILSLVKLFVMRQKKPHSIPASKPLSDIRKRDIEQFLSALCIESGVSVDKCKGIVQRVTRMVVENLRDKVAARLGTKPGHYPLWRHVTEIERTAAAEELEEHLAAEDIFFSRAMNSWASKAQIKLLWSSRLNEQQKSIIFTIFLISYSRHTASQANSDFERYNSDHDAPSSDTEIVLPREHHKLLNGTNHSESLGTHEDNKQDAYTRPDKRARTEECTGADETFNQGKVTS